MNRAALVLATVLTLTACQKAPVLDADAVADLIESSKAFQEVDPGVKFIDAAFRPGADCRRQFVRLDSLTVKDDGPFAIAGKTATVIFSYRWTAGPYAGRTFLSKAKLNCSGECWKLYPDTLRAGVWAAERGEGAE